jgi:hypothetical protein
MRDLERGIIPMARNEWLTPYGVLNQGRFQTVEKEREREEHNRRKFIPLSEHDKNASNFRGC